MANSTLLISALLVDAFSFLKSYWSGRKCSVQTCKSHFWSLSFICSWRKRHIFCRLPVLVTIRPSKVVVERSTDQLQNLQIRTHPDHRTKFLAFLATSLWLALVVADNGNTSEAIICVFPLVLPFRHCRWILVLLEREGKKKVTSKQARDACVPTTNSVSKDAPG